MPLISTTRWDGEDPSIRIAGWPDDVTPSRTCAATPVCRCSPCLSPTHYRILHDLNAPCPGLHVDSVEAPRLCSKIDAFCFPSGAFATVVKGVHKVDNQKYAVKIISRSAFQECAEMLHKEINILHMIGQHKYVVTLKEVLHAPLRVYMVFGEPPEALG